MRWIKDDDFIRGDIPMTKFNIRILTIGHMEIEKGDRFLDIGAGTGSISIEASLQGAEVTAIERKQEGVDLIRKNAEKFSTRINIIQGEAKDSFPEASFNKVFIGGSRGQLVDVFEYLEDKLEKGGILCGNFIMLKNLEEFTRLLKEYGYREVQTHMVQASSVDKIGLLRGENPIFIVRGVKN